MSKSHNMLDGVSAYWLIERRVYSNGFESEKYIDMWNVPVMQLAATSKASADSTLARSNNVNYWNRQYPAGRDYENADGTHDEKAGGAVSGKNPVLQPRM